MKNAKEPNEKRDAAIEKCLAEVRAILTSDLKYGTVSIIMQDGIPIQIDTTEKKRFI